MRTELPDNPDRLGAERTVPRRERGGLLLGCAIFCGVMFVLVIVGLMLMGRWLFAPVALPDPQSVMLANAQSFVVARLNPANKAVLDLINQVAREGVMRSEREAGGPPWPIRWLLGEDPASLAKKLLPVQIVFSDAPAARQMSLVFSPGRGRGWATLLSRAMRMQIEQKENKPEYVTYKDTVIFRNPPEKEKQEWWLAISDASICGANTADGVKAIMDSMGDTAPASPSKVNALYPNLSGSAVVCGASADLFRIQHLLNWFLAGDVKAAPPMQLRGVSLGTFKLSLTEQFALHLSVELTCANAQVAQGLQQGLQTHLMPKQLANQITGVRVLNQAEKVYVDFDVPEFDKIIIKAIKERQSPDKEKPAQEEKK